MSAFVLKLIAILAMLIDHISWMFRQSFTSVFFPDSMAASGNMLTVMHIIGRLTFPIMAFFIAEGCRKTRSMPKYMARLFGFGVLSQIPHTLAVFMANNSMNRDSLTFIDLRAPNVLFTLGLGALAIFLYEKFNHKPLAYVSVILVTAASGLLQVEYSVFGVPLVFAAYALPTRKTRLLGMAAVLTPLYLVYSPGWQNTMTVLNSPTPFWTKLADVFLLGFGQWLAALATLIILYFYNGERGKKAKYLFYIFYPAHFLVLTVIRELIR